MSAPASSRSGPPPRLRGAAARLVALLGAALLGGALLVTAWASYASVRAASSTLLRGQASAVQQAVRAHLLELEGPPSEAALQAILEDETPAGLRALVLLDRGHAPLRVGQLRGPLLPDPARVAALAEEPVRVGDRVRLTFRARVPVEEAALGGRNARERGRPTLVVLEVEPVQAEALRRAAVRTLAIGAVAAAALFAGALLLLRWLLRQAELERQLERERRLAGLGEMSAVLAHEIKNPLASLKGNAQLLAHALADSERHGAKARRVVDEAVRLERLTGSLLEYVRTGELHREPASPAELLQEAAEAVRTGSAPGQLALAPQESGAPWLLDKERIRQVLVNLLDNALATGAPVRASVREEAGQLRFDVQDAGPGVPPSERERIFEPFHTTRTRGTGLGLAVARRVVEQHGGSIRVQEAPGGGALFTVVLPRG
ncbi:HAMP domain-containing histidine kinase [Aggregicoccus sp. 17bor-14]|uniref:two-component system sensor histidine kinase NtrB n=1 Tax=Myxococcaceae TaxID=31 RepID=UPI00129C3F26|nr:MULTISPECIES: HAMP domain-containing sensor histidine kinase [Myxococcaceae]MBF5043053.1 HAMP domain-containing histidine kinase [Simulacricoccus sp. 17bor-14]MRI88816.1 HAMP domain-containing histidine kinase [Aggregicoccus sp. 17bor-14]